MCSSLLWGTQGAGIGESLRNAKYLPGQQPGTRESAAKKGGRDCGNAKIEQICWIYRSQLSETQLIRRLDGRGRAFGGSRGSLDIAMGVAGIVGLVASIPGIRGVWARV